VLCAFLLWMGVGCHREDPKAVKRDAVTRGDAALAANKFAEAITAYRIAAGVDGQDGSVRLKLAIAYRGLRQWPSATREAILAADLLPENRVAQLQAIEALNNQGRFLDAVGRAGPYLMKEPHSPELLILFANGKARLATTTSGLYDLQEALRHGRDFEGARLRLRPTASQSDDREAERAYREAFQLAPKEFNSDLALAGFLWAAGDAEEGSTLLRAAADETPSHSFLSRAFGLYCHYRGRDAEAEKYLLIAASRGEVDSRLALADFFRWTKRPEKAIPILADLVTTGNDASGEATLRVAEIELSMGRADDAMRRAEAVLARAPNNPWALQIKADVLLRSGDVQGARNTARDAVLSGPTSREAHWVLARALVASGALDDAFVEYTTVWRDDGRDAVVAREFSALALRLNKPDVALEMAEQSVTLDPRNREGGLALARAQVRVADFAGAERTLAPLIAGRTLSRDELLLQGAIQAGRGHEDAARASYQRVLDLERDSRDALSGLVALEMKAKQFAHVRPLVERAVAAHPREAVYLLLDARIAHAMGDKARAEARLRTALEVDPANEDAALLFGDVLTGQARLTEARAVLEAALARHPASLALQMARALVLEALNLPAEARTQYEAIVAVNRDDAVASWRLAAIYANQGENLDVAVQLASLARRKLPDDPVVSDVLGWVYVRKRIANAGLSYLEAAVRAQPSNALFHYHLGVAYERLGQFVKARDELLRALAIDPKFPGAADAKSILAGISK